MHYVCSRCEAVHPKEHGSQWGKTKESDGYGPRAICTALVPNGVRSLDPQRGMIEGMQVCGGDLALVAETTAAVSRKVRAVRPITAWEPPTLNSEAVSNG